MESPCILLKDKVTISVFNEEIKYEWVAYSVELDFRNIMP